MVLLKCCDIAPNGCEVILLIVSFDKVICPVLLVAGDEVFVVDRWEGLILPHEGLEFHLELVVEDLCSSHCVGHVVGIDVPSTNNQILWSDHGKNLVDLQINLPFWRISYLYR